MSILEQLLAKTCIAAVGAVGALWRDCGRCHGLRWRWHRHTPLPASVVVELHRNRTPQQRDWRGDFGA